MSASAVRVLVVDDESCIRNSLVNYLEDRGCKVVSAESAEEALETLRTEAVDVAIVDIRLPGMDGNGLIFAAHEMLPLAEVCRLHGVSRIPPASRPHRNRGGHGLRLSETTAGSERIARGGQPPGHGRSSPCVKAHRQLY